MPRYFLTRLKIEGFRGVNNESDPLDLRFQPGCVNSVFAVNGIGKSSIFDALCYAIFGTIPKLQTLQAQERPEDYYCNRFHSQKSAILDLEFLPDDGGNAVTLCVRRDATGNRTVSSPSGHPDPEGFLKTLREAFALLDYRNFARFVEDSPLERGRTFSALLGLSEYSDRRQALQAVSDSRALNSDLEIKVLTTALAASQQGAQQALSAARASYEKVTGNPLQDIGRLDEYAAEVARALGDVELLKQHFAGKALAEIEFDSIKAAIKTAEGGENRRELEQALQAIAALEALAAHDLATAQSNKAQLESLVDARDALLAATRGDLFKRLYDAAQALIEKGAWTHDEKCPLCENDFGASISAHIGGQLAQYTEAAAKATEIKDVWLASAWRKLLAAYETASALGIEAKERRFAGLDAKFASGEITRDDLATSISWTGDLVARAEEKLRSLRDRKAALENELPASLVQLTEQVEYGRQFKEALERYREKQREEAGVQTRLDVRERWKKFISRATTLFADAEVALSKAKITDIDAEYKDMFRDIMNVADVVPQLQRADGREDLHVQLSDFHGQHRLSARALLSESYRNALAIAVFLAAAVEHSGVPRFVVLDDVTSSFDAGHQYFLMELIRTKLQQPNNPNGLQFIILSHDGLLEKYFDRLGGTSDWHHNKLQGSPPMGAILSHTQGADRLKITSRMVNNCLDAITSAVDLHRRAGSLILDAQQVSDLGTVHVPAIVGNWVSHYETESGSSLSAPVLSGVIASIDALAECFRWDDSSSGTVARKWYRSLSSR
jgi:DNA repair exonuclease SbcCD ATPase subunit